MTATHGSPERRARAAGSTSASTARAVSPIRTTWGSHALYAGQVKAARPRRGQGAGGCGRPPLPPSTR